MELSANSKSSYLNKITYVNLRWIGIIGQFITINSVAFLFKFEFNFILANIVVLLGVLSNILPVDSITAADVGLLMGGKFKTTKQVEPIK